MPSESDYRTRLFREIEATFTGCYILHPNPNDIQGFPDLLILYKNKWAAIETKKAMNSSKRANQSYYIQKLNSMSFAIFASRENHDYVMTELTRYFRD